MGLADRVSPAFGTAVLWFLLGLYAALVIATVVFFLRMPEAARAARQRDGAGIFPAPRRPADRAWPQTPASRGYDLSSRAGIEKALEDLGRECDVIIRDSAAAVFVSTAISQSGRLDTVFVLTAHFRMVWRIAGVYSQRPALRELLNLYANVAATAFVAGELDEAEIGEQIEPILSSALGAVSLSVPGVQAAASIVVTSILTGAANAFLTLRVGIIARRWCGSLVSPTAARCAARPRPRRRNSWGPSSRAARRVSRGPCGTPRRARWAEPSRGSRVLARDIKDSLFALLKLKKGEE